MGSAFVVLGAFYCPAVSELAAVAKAAAYIVFPAMGVEAVRRVPPENRGTALGVYSGFADLSFFSVGPIAGAVITHFGYSSAFLFAFISVLTALVIAVVLWRSNVSERIRSKSQA